MTCCGAARREASFRRKRRIAALSAASLPPSQALRAISAAPPPWLAGLLRRNPRRPFARRRGTSRQAEANALKRIFSAGRARRFTGKSVQRWLTAKGAGLMRGFDPRQACPFGVRHAQARMACPLIPLGAPGALPGRAKTAARRGLIRRSRPSCALFAPATASPREESLCRLPRLGKIASLRAATREPLVFRFERAEMLT